MPLETLQPGVPIKINNLTLEMPHKPESGLPFDANRDIFPSDIEEFSRRLVGLRNLNRRSHYTELSLAEGLVSLKILFPERPLPIEPDETLFNSLQQRNITNDFTEEYVFCRHLFPEISSSSYSRDIISVMGQPPNSSDIYLGNVVEFALNRIFSKMLFNPTQKLPRFFEIDLTSRINADLYKIGNDSFESKDIYARAKIVFGKNYGNLNPYEWKRMHQKLKDLRAENSWEAFFRLAKNMKTLLAEKVELTEKGLEITMPQPKPQFIIQPPPLPEARRF